MAYVTIDMAKRHLNVELDYSGDDELIQDYIEAAESVVSSDLNESLQDMENEEGNIPKHIRQAILLLVGHFYANREPVAFANVHEVPLSYKHLISLSRNYLK